MRNWELHVQFKVHGAGKNLFGDGFVIWYARDRLQQGNNFKASLSIGNNFQLFKSDRNSRKTG